MLDLTKPIRGKIDKLPARFLTDNLRKYGNRYAVFVIGQPEQENLFTCPLEQMEAEFENVPSSTYRPYHESDEALFESLMGKYIVNKEGFPFFRMTITSIFIDREGCWKEVTFNRYSALWLFKAVQFANGTPFGVEVGENDVDPFKEAQERADRECEQLYRALKRSPIKKRKR